MDTMTPPDVPITNYPTGYPNPTRRLGRAWADMWAQLRAVERAHPADSDMTWLDGTVLVQVAAEKSGLQETTLISFLTRAATAGVLEREHRTVDGSRGPRKRTFYRVPR